MLKAVSSISILNEIRKMSSKYQGFPVDIKSIDHKLEYPSTTRNAGPILEVLKQVLMFAPESEPFLLEVSSGTGQHAAHFAAHFPNITFQPSEVEEDLLKSISSYASECPTKNIKQPLFIDVLQDLSIHGFTEKSIDVIYNCNMIHVSPYECTVSLFRNAGKYLKDNGTMITYGPYAHNGIITPESNIAFDKAIREKNPKWGLKDINDLIKLGEENSIFLKNIFDMPANNKCLIWIKVK